ncbi:MAG: type II toxin-antitoxin system RelE/ParE family toxin [Oscillospiraceae bacterium]|nr:type II toxin-antitoxin system RelE/ParE family toxin [Oscillospiraceae bacterium]
MSYKIEITKEANADIDEVLTYISVNLGSKFAANDMMSELEDRFKLLSASPEMYELCRSSRLREKGYRRFLLKNYIVFYKIKETERTVYIVRIIYGKRDYINLL